jgi:hypothetical protein
MHQKGARCLNPELVNEWEKLYFTLNFVKLALKCRFSLHYLI